MQTRSVLVALGLTLAVGCNSSGSGDHPTGDDTGDVDGGRGSDAGGGDGGSSTDGDIDGNPGPHTLADGLCTPAAITADTVDPDCVYASATRVSGTTDANVFFDLGVPSTFVYGGDNSRRLVVRPTTGRIILAREGGTYDDYAEFVADPTPADGSPTVASLWANDIPISTPACTGPASAGPVSPLSLRVFPDDGVALYGCIGGGIDRTGRWYLEGETSTTFELGTDLLYGLGASRHALVMNQDTGQLRVISPTDSVDVTPSTGPAMQHSVIATRWQNGAFIVAIHSNTGPTNVSYYVDLIRVALDGTQTAIGRYQVASGKAATLNTCTLDVDQHLLCAWDSSDNKMYRYSISAPEEAIAIDSAAYRLPSVALFTGP